ncbi:hypothetical protein AGMMS49579_10200 [Spirochaetia bacterium]|nr:hypothetical protein AGMMS49579_10200 [Spirochaetia bacterium]
MVTKPGKTGIFLINMRIGVHHYYGQVLILLMVLALNSCNRKNEDIPIIPPVTPPLSRPYIGYGVINVSYTHVVEEPDPASPSLGYLRRGSIVKIIERRPFINQGNPSSAGGAAESWVLADGGFQGWLTESVMDIYDNESRARTAAESMTR